MRAWVVAVVGAVALLPAAPARAEQIGIDYADIGPVPADPTQRTVDVEAAPGEQNDITVRATDPTPIDPIDPGSGGWPLTVTVTDQHATFDPTPPTGDLACEVLDAHTARCAAPPGSHFVQAFLQLGDGNNHAQFASDTVPLREQFLAGDGNDVVSTGPFAGDASYRWASDLGGGNDTIHIGPWRRDGFGGGVPPTGLAVYLGAGNDTAYSINGAADVIDCGTGNDTLYADPFDTNQIYSPPPGVCENRLPPAAP